MNKVAIIAMDIHKKFSRVAPMSSAGEVLGDVTVSHENAGTMREFFSRFAPGTDVVMEATFNWPWIADVAREMGLCPHLAHPMRAREMAKGMSKSDRKDGIFLGKLFLSPEIFPASYLAPQPVRRMRDVFRLRLLMVRIRTKLKNNIHGQFFRMGFVFDEEVSDLFSKKGRAMLAEAKLEKHERRMLQEKLALLDQVGEHIESLEKNLKKVLKSDGRAKILMSLPGIAEITAYTILAEIGEIERFPNSRALAAYAGLLPLSNESGGKDFGKHFGKHTGQRCNHALRCAMIEAVTGAVRKSPRMRSKHARIKARNKDKAGKARVAVARELIELAYLLLSRGELYQEKRSPRPGSIRSGREKKKASGIKKKSRTIHPNRASQMPLCAGSH